MNEVKKEEGNTAEERQAALEGPGQSLTYRTGATFAKQVHAHIGDVDNATRVAAAKRSSIVIPANAKANNRGSLNVQSSQAQQKAAPAGAKKTTPDAPTVSTG
jgi:hypothetical protein